MPSHLGRSRLPPSPFPEVLESVNKLRSRVRELFLGVEEFPFCPQKSKEVTGCSIPAWVDVWVEISLVWVEKARVGG